MKIFAKYNKYDNKLSPVYLSDYDNLKTSKLKHGEEYEVEIKKKRNYKFHKKFMALINICHENQEKFTEFDDTREYITIKCGFKRKVIMPNGYVHIKAKSISFANMDEIEFEQLYQKAILEVCNFLKIKKGELLDEILNFM